ncbi:MAG: right-handed parallel beta-helix repeat-containing protein, partial [Planctomycetota bacterium]|jgi:parallel beta-helix repeat protein
MSNNTLFKNKADFWGGGIFCQDSSSTVIRDNTFEENQSGNDKDGSAGNGGGVACRLCSPLIENNVFTANVVESGEGGAIYLDESTGTIQGNTISENTADEGGGIVCANASLPMVTRNIVTNNEATWGGGGIMWKYDCHPVIYDNVITGNTAHQGRGGGIYFNGDVPVAAGRPAGPGRGPERTGVAADNLISGNIAKEGGGIGCYREGLVDLTGNLILGNQALEEGGGVSLLATSPSFTNNLIKDNEAGTRGGGIYLISCDTYFCNNTVTGNSAMDQGGGIFCSNYSDAMDRNMILWGNSASAGPEIGIKYSTFSIGYSDVAGGQTNVYIESGGILNWHAGMIDSDPHFVDAAGNDLHILYDSPCRNTGKTATVMKPNDFEGDPRPAHGPPDMGADEFHAHFYCTGDATPGGAIEGMIVGLPATAPVGLFLSAGILDPPMSTQWGFFS